MEKAKRLGRLAVVSAIFFCILTLILVTQPRPAPVPTLIPSATPTASYTPMPTASPTLTVTPTIASTSLPAVTVDPTQSAIDWFRETVFYTFSRNFDDEIDDIVLMYNVTDNEVTARFKITRMDDVTWGMRALVCLAVDMGFLNHTYHFTGVVPIVDSFGNETWEEVIDIILTPDVINRLNCVNLPDIVLSDIAERYELNADLLDEEG